MAIVDRNMYSAYTIDMDVWNILKDSEKFWRASCM
jgi:hypothetical protein